MDKQINELLRAISEKLDLDIGDWEIFKYDIINEINNYGDIRQKCITIMKNEPLKYHEIGDLLSYCVFTNQIKEYMLLSEWDDGVDIYELVNYIRECGYGIEFMKELTKQCRVNELDLYGEIIFICSNEHDLLFLDNNQFTNMLINKLSDDNLDLSLSVIFKLLHIIT